MRGRATRVRGTRPTGRHLRTVEVETVPIALRHTTGTGAILRHAPTARLRADIPLLAAIAAVVVAIMGAPAVVDLTAVVEEAVAFMVAAEAATVEAVGTTK